MIIEYSWTFYISLELVLAWKGPYVISLIILSCILAEMVHSGKRQVFFPPQLPLLQGVPACWGIMFLCSRELQQWHTHGLPLNHMQSKMGFCNNLSSPHPFHRSEHGWHRFTPLLSLSIPFHLSFGFNSFRFWDLEHERETGSRSTRNAFESLGARVTELGQGAGLLVGIVEWTKLLPKATEGGFL